MRVALQEGSDALAALGDVRGALDLLHREQALRAEINADNQAAILAQMRATYRAEAERRELDLLERENALRSSHLQTQTLIERIWVAAIVLLGLAAGVVGMLALRARDATRRLRHSEALLRVQSERDPLTGLANRRHFREVLATRGSAAFRGALLLVDVDHFKRINDEFGHPAGDAVLIEVARRLDTSVRAGDLVCRWGGEEFLIFAPDLQGEALDALALRVLRALGDEAIALDNGRFLPVSASLGYAAFPLPAHQVALGWERAVNLVDMALYTAKSMGRDRAVGIQSVSATDPLALQSLEADFEAARLAGEVDLQVSLRREY
jgi:diguanylate cyclase (GGDEF)-like protein